MRENDITAILGENKHSLLDPIMPLDYGIKNIVDKGMFERLPVYVNESGVFSPKFQTFYNNIVHALEESDWGRLYILSDLVLSSQEYIQLAEKSIGKLWRDHIVNADANTRGCDLDINPERFRSLHRNILGGLILSVYFFEPCKGDLSGVTNRKLSKYWTELMFTYKFGEFVLVSNFSNWVKDEDE